MTLWDFARLHPIGASIAFGALLLTVIACAGALGESGWR